MYWGNDRQRAGAVAEQIRSAGWEVCLAQDAQSVRQLIENDHVAVGLADLSGSPSELDRAEDLLASCRLTSWIAVLLHASLQNPALRGIVGRYCYDYHTLPLQSERLLLSIGHAHGMATLAQTMHDETAAEREAEMVGACPAMLAHFRDIRKVATVDEPVLITGESGSGKELTAQAIHERSARVDGPFVALNCGVLPANLIQSELFGHEKGAFTGANQRKIGQIAKAEKGTLFLDEIGDLPLDLQINLLRFLEQKTIRRVGGGEEIPVDVRVLAATHVNLEEAVAAGRFREDLYFRLNVLRLHVPALRDRAGDIEILAQYFLEKFSPRTKPAFKSFSPDAYKRMLMHPWPGNVRELANRIRRAIVMADGRLITAADLGFTQKPDAGLAGESVTLETARNNAEREAIRMAMRAVGNNLSLAARKLDISRSTLYALLAKHQINCDDLRMRDRAPAVKLSAPQL